MLVAFDMFGTLADTASVARELAPSCGGHGRPRGPDLAGQAAEYMFRVTAMGLFPRSPT